MNLMVFFISFLMLASTQSTPQQGTTTPTVAPRAKRFLGLWLLMELLGPVTGAPQNVSLLVDGKEVTLVAARPRRPLKQQTSEPAGTQGQLHRVCRGKAANTKRCKLYLAIQKATSDPVQTTDLPVTDATETDE